VGEKVDIPNMIKVLEENKKMLLSKANVTGVAIGYKKVGGQLTKEICIVVYVSKKLPLKDLKARDVIPPTIGPYVTDVVEAEFTALQSRTSRIRPAKGGISVGHYQITAGTITNIFYDFTRVQDKTLNTKVLVSNNHVIAFSDLGRIGDPILQPGPYDGGTVENDTIATLDRYRPLAESPRVIDGAVGMPVSQDDVTVEHFDFGALSSPAAVPYLGLRILKGGRTTGLTEATIVALNATVYVSGYPQGTLTFTNQIIGEAPSAWIAGGDSGSLAVTKDGRKCVGVCFAGSANGLIGVMNDFATFSSILGIGFPALIHIRVVDKNGAPIKGVVVSVPETNVVSSTDSNGMVTVGNVPIGKKVRVVTYHPDYESKTTEITVSEQVEDFTITLEPAPPPEIPLPQKLALSGAYIGSLLTGFVVAQTILVPQVGSSFKELLEVLVEKTRGGS